MEAPSIEGRGPAVGARRLLWTVGWPVRSVLVGFVRLYRATLSGLLGGQCRFEPSCSHYAEQAIRARGAAIGTAFAAWRVLRCNPFARGGRDEPPSPVYDDVIRKGPTT